MTASLTEFQGGVESLPPAFSFDLNKARHLLAVLGKEDYNLAPLQLEYEMQKGGNGLISKAAYDLAKLFISSDIEREIQLVRGQNLWWKRLLRHAWGVRPGGGNFLAALGLLCYTEFAGRLKRNDFTEGNSRDCFDDFFADLGPAYAALLNQCQPYKDLRCGLAHEYFVKKSCTIAMLEAGQQTGVYWDGRQYTVIVEPYWRDFAAAFDRLGQVLFGAT